MESLSRVRWSLVAFSALTFFGLVEHSQAQTALKVGDRVRVAIGSGFNGTVAEVVGKGDYVVKLDAGGSEGRSMEFKTGGHNGILLALGAGDAVIGDVNDLENRAPGATPAPGKLLPNRPFVRAPRAAEPSPERANPAPIAREEPRSAPAAALDFREKDLHGRSFEKTRLDGADFSGANLQDCKFGGASVRKAIFKDADVKGAWLTDADFTESDMREMRGDPLITGSHFDRANLQGLTIKVANCTFKGANLRDCVIIGYTYGCDFSGADLRGVNLRPAALADGPAANRWKGVLYDDDTAWPDGFDPVAAGAVLVKGDAK